MSRKVLAGVLAFFFLLFSLPIANADDSPLLTWERGKEQNVVLGGTTAAHIWQVKLLRPDSPQIVFVPSSRNTKGFLVYSARLPSDLTIGRYEIYVFKDSVSAGTVVSLVNVVEMTRYDISQIPHDLAFIFFFFTFLLVMLSVIKDPKYSPLKSLRQRTFLETGLSRLGPRLPQFIYTMYGLRATWQKQYKHGALRYLFSHDGDFLQKLSPLLWSIMPFIGALAGVEAGITTRDQAPNIPIYIMAGIAVIGVLDSFSGLFTFVTFLCTQIILGQVLSVRALLVLSIMGVGWIFSGVFSNFLYLSTLRDYADSNEQSLLKLRNFAVLIVSSVVTALFFFGTQIFADSLATNAGSNRSFMMQLSIAIGVISGVKIRAHSRLDNKILSQGSGDTLIADDHHYSTSISLTWTLTITFITGLVGFHWSQSTAVASAIAILSFAIFSTFSPHFTPPKLKILKIRRRNICIEAAIVIFINFLLFTYIETLPYTTNQKTEIFMLVSFVVPILHRLISILQPPHIIPEES